MLKEVSEIIVDLVIIDAEKITPQAALRADLGMSSLDLINLAVELENKYNVKISDREIISSKSVSDVLALIESKRVSVG